MTAPRIKPQGLLLASALLVGAAGTPSAAAEGPAFDCAKASGEIETLICEDAELAALDRELAGVYAASLQALKGVADEKKAVKSLKAHQRGWIKGRNDCWKAGDKRRCAGDLYKTRVAELQARYALAPGGEPVFYVCNRNPADEIVATFFPTDPPAARLERGDRQVIALQTRAASGSKYVADFGIMFWEKGGEAQVEWPEGAKFECTAR